MTAQAGDISLAGLRTVVTGAGTGIGRAIAVAFAGAGARVGLGHWRSAQAAAELAAALPAGAGAHPALRADLSTADGCAALVADAYAALGGVDVWVNNAGADILTGDAAGWPDEDKLDALLALDLRGTIRCSRAVAQRMGADGGGVILNMGWDRAAEHGMAGDDAQLHAAVKAAVLGFSKSLARSVAPAVRVNVLCPGWIETAYGEGADRDFYDAIVAETPLQRWGTPQDVAGAALWLASPAASFITGQAINVNGGTVG